IRRLAIDAWLVRVTSAPPPSRAARESRTVSVPSGSIPAITTSANPPQRKSSSAPRSPCFLLRGLTRIGPSSQNRPATVPSPSIHTALSPWATVVVHAALNTAVAPPCGIHTVNLLRGNPRPGRIASSGSIPVATGSAVRCVTGVASGNRCSISARMAELRSDIALQNIPNRTRKQEVCDSRRSHFDSAARSPAWSGPAICLLRPRLRTEEDWIPAFIRLDSAELSIESRHTSLSRLTIDGAFEGDLRARLTRGNTGRVGDERRDLVDHHDATIGEGETSPPRELLIGALESGIGACARLELRRLGIVDSQPCGSFKRQFLIGELRSRIHRLDVSAIGEVHAFERTGGKGARRRGKSSEEGGRSRGAHADVDRSSSRRRRKIPLDGGIRCPWP